MALQRGVKGDAVGVVETEADDVAVLELFLLDADAVDEDAVTLAAVLQPVAAVHVDDGGAGAGDAGVFKDEVVAAFVSAAHLEGGGGDGDELRCGAGADYFKDDLDGLAVMAGFKEWWQMGKGAGRGDPHDSRSPTPVSQKRAGWGPRSRDRRYMSGYMRMK